MLNSNMESVDDLLPRLSCDEVHPGQDVYHPNGHNNPLVQIFTRREERLKKDSEKALGEMIDERDKLERNLDSLADAVAAYFKADIGEHSSMNDPWYNAFQLLRDNTRNEKI